LGSVPAKNKRQQIGEKALTFGMDIEYELYYRFTCRKFCHDVTAIPIELKWSKRFINEDAAYAELESIVAAKRTELMKEYEECLGPVKYVRDPFSKDPIGLV